MKKKLIFIYGSRRYTVERGQIYEDIDGFFKVVSISCNYELPCFIKLREMRISKSGNAYPVKGQEGVRFLITSELVTCRYFTKKLNIS